MRYLSFIVPALLLLLASCEGNKNKKLYGTWNAAAVVQNDRALEVELSEINFHFHEDGTYQFASTLDYKEAGSYQLDGDKLYTLDTLRQESIGKIVKVEKLGSDTLQLRMKKESEWMLVTLIKN